MLRKRPAANPHEDEQLKAEWERLALDYFGLTDNITEAGFILFAGSLLDFSGRRDLSNDFKRDEDGYYRPRRGRDYMLDRRASDHRDISQPIEALQGGGGGMWQFSRVTRAIRVACYSHNMLVQFSAMPSPEQLQHLVKQLVIGVVLDCHLNVWPEKELETRGPYTVKQRADLPKFARILRAAYAAPAES